MGRLRVYRASATPFRVAKYKKEPAVSSYRPEEDYTKSHLSSASPCVKSKGQKDSYDKTLQSSRARVFDWLAVEAGRLFDRVYQVEGAARKFYFLSDSEDWLELSGKELKQALEKSREWPSTENRDAFFEELKHHVAQFNQLYFAFNQLPGMEKRIHRVRVKPSGEIVRVLVRRGGGRVS
jgi:hypothetical protein